MFCRQLAKDAGLGRIAERLHEFKVDGLLIIGGFEVSEGPALLYVCDPWEPIVQWMEVSPSPCLCLSTVSPSLCLTLSLLQLYSRREAGDF